jgi:hypothetical protein
MNGATRKFKILREQVATESVDPHYGAATFKRAERQNKRRTHQEGLF